MNFKFGAGINSLDVVPKFDMTVVVEKKIKQSDSADELVFVPVWIFYGNQTFLTVGGADPSGI